MHDRVIWLAPLPGIIGSVNGNKAVRLAIAPAGDLRVTDNEDISVGKHGCIHDPFIITVRVR